MAITESGGIPQGEYWSDFARWYRTFYQKEPSQSDPAVLVLYNRQDIKEFVAQWVTDVPVSVGSTPISTGGTTTGTTYPPTNFGATFTEVANNTNLSNLEKASIIAKSFPMQYGYWLTTTDGKNYADSYATDIGNGYYQLPDGNYVTVNPLGTGYIVSSAPPTSTTKVWAVDPSGNPVTRESNGYVYRVFTDGTLDTSNAGNMGAAPKASALPTNAKLVAKGVYFDGTNYYEFDGTPIDSTYAQSIISAEKAGASGVPSGSQQVAPGVFFNGTTYYDSNGNVMSSAMAKAEIDAYNKTAPTHATNPDGSMKTTIVNGYMYPVNSDGTTDFSTNLGSVKDETSMTAAQSAANTLAQQELAFNQQKFTQEFGLSQAQFAWQQQQAAAELAAQEKARLAELKAKPINWLQYSAQSGIPAVVQPWMVPLSAGDYPQLQTGQVLNWGGTGTPTGTTPTGATPTGTVPTGGNTGGTTPTSSTMPTQASSWSGGTNPIGGYSGGSSGGYADPYTSSSTAGQPKDYSVSLAIDPITGKLISDYVSADGSFKLPAGTQMVNIDPSTGLPFADMNGNVVTSVPAPTAPPPTGPLADPALYGRVLDENLAVKTSALAEDQAAGLDPTGQTAAALGVDTALFNAFKANEVTPYTNTYDPAYIASQNDPAVVAARAAKAAADAAEAKRLADYRDMTPQDYEAAYITPNATAQNWYYNSATGQRESTPPAEPQTDMSYAGAGGGTIMGAIAEQLKNWSGNVPEFARGGTVPGQIGQPVPVIAHGGERFLGPSEEEKKRRRTRDANRNKTNSLPYREDDPIATTPVIISPTQTTPIVQTYTVPTAQTVAPTTLPNTNIPVTGLPNLLRPSAQYNARMGPTAQQQYLGYEQARTGAIPEETQFRMWSMAPPSGSPVSLNYRR
jgi:hypothetical protein